MAPRTYLAVLTLALSATSPAWAQTSRPTLAMPPATLGQLIVDAYPKGAAAAHVEGDTRMGCHVSETGTLSDCKIVSEAPMGRAFGAASIHVAQRIQMNPAMQDGRPVASEAVIPIHWRLASPSSLPQDH